MHRWQSKISTPFRLEKKKKIPAADLWQTAVLLVTTKKNTQCWGVLRNSLRSGPPSWVAALSYVISIILICLIPGAKYAVSLIGRQLRDLCNYLTSFLVSQVVIGQVLRAKYGRVKRAPSTTDSRCELLWSKHINHPPIILFLRHILSKSMSSKLSRESFAWKTTHWSIFPDVHGVWLFSVKVTAPFA